MIRFLLVLVPIIFVASCSSDNESELTGIWRLSQLKVDCPSDGEFYNFEANNGCYTVENSESCFSINLREDGTGTITTSEDGESDVTEITYTESNNQVTLCYTSNDCETLQFSDGKLTYESPGGECIENYVFTKG